MPSPRDPVNTSQSPHWAQSDLVWPAGFTCIGRKTGSRAHGETWIIRDDIPEAIAALEKKQAKVEAGVKVVSGQIVDIEERLARLDEDDNAELDELDAEINAQRADSYDPYAEQDVYGDNDDEDSQSEENPKWKTKKEALLNLHNYDDPEVALEEKNRILTGLEDSLDTIKLELEELRRNTFQMTWGKKSIPAQLARVDAPWLQFAEKADRSAALPANDPVPKVSGGKGSTKKNRKNLAAGTTSQPEEDAPIEKREFCAKVVCPGMAEASDGRRFKASDALVDSAAVRSLLIDGEELLKQQWRLVISVGKGDFDAVCVLPLVAVVDVKHSNHAELREAAFISPLCPNGSLSEAVGKIAGKKKDYWFVDELILRNLKTTINALALLECNGVIHGGIKPSNIYISTDGFSLLLGDFVPQTELRRWFADLAKSLSNAPVYFSPELYDLLVVKKTRGYTAIQEKINLHKHDVFCLGLTYYYITTRIDPKGFHRDKKKIDAAMRSLNEERHIPELVEYLTQMLTMKQDDRPSFWDMLKFTEKASITGQTFLSGVKNLLGIADKTEQEVAAGTSGGPTTSISGRAEQSGCGVQ